MVERERWIVYPLIFFLLLLVLRDSILETVEVEAGTLICNQLLVKTLDDQKLISMSGHLDRGYITIYGPLDDDVANPRWTESPDASAIAEPIVQIGVRNGGGYAMLVGSDDAPDLSLGHYEDYSGLIALDNKGVAYPGTTPINELLWGATIPWGNANAEEPTDSSEGDPRNAEPEGEGKEESSQANEAAASRENEQPVLKANE